MNIQIRLINIFINNARAIICTLSFAFPIPAKIQKLILNKIWKINHHQIYCSKIPENKNLLPNKILAICGPNAINNHHILVANIEKYL